MITTLANPRVQNFGEDFVVPRSRDGIVILEDDLAALFVDEGHGLSFGDGCHCSVLLSDCGCPGK